MIVAVGGGETEEFQRQSRAFAETCQATGCVSELELVKGANHYTILNQLGDATAPLCRAILQQMGLR